MTKETEKRKWIVNNERIINEKWNELFRTEYKPIENYLNQLRCGHLILIRSTIKDEK